MTHQTINTFYVPIRIIMTQNGYKQWQLEAGKVRLIWEKLPDEIHIKKISILSWIDLLVICLVGETSCMTEMCRAETNWPSEKKWFRLNWWQTTYERGKRPKPVVTEAQRRGQDDGRQRCATETAMVFECDQGTTVAGQEREERQGFVFWISD